MNEEDVFLTSSTVARLISRSEGSVRYYANTGKLPCITTSTGQRLFRESDVREFANKRRDRESPSAA